MSKAQYRPLFWHFSPDREHRTSTEKIRRKFIDNGYLKFMITSVLCGTNFVSRNRHPFVLHTDVNIHRL